MKFLKTLLCGVMATTILTSCSPKEADIGDELKPITMALMKAQDAVPIIIAKEKGYFEEEGLTVNLETFSNARDRDIAFQGSDEIDGALIDLVATAIYNESDIPVIVTSQSVGLFGIMSNDGVKELADIKDKKVIIAKNTAIDYILTQTLKSVGLTDQDVDIEEVPALPTRVELVSNNQADVTIVPEPFVTIGKSSGLSQLSTNIELGVNPFVYVFKKEVLETKSEEVKAFYRAYNKVIDFINENDKSEYVDYIIDAVGYPESFREDLDIPNFPKHKLPSEQEVEDVFSWARERGLLTKELSFSDVTFEIGND